MVNTVEISYMNAKDMEEWLKADFKFPPNSKGQPWAGRVSPETINLLVARRHRNLINPAIFYMKATDRETKEIVAGPKWHHIIPQSLTSCEDNDLVPTQPPEEHTTAELRLLESAKHHRQAIVGNRPYLHLTNLSTRLQYRGRGAASTLIRWGLELADELQLDVFAEAHEASKTLYEKFGFRAVNQFEMETGQNGAEKVLRLYVSDNFSVVSLLRRFFT